MFAWLFKHPVALYQQGELVFAGEFGVLWWLAAALLLGLSILFARRLRGWSLWRRVTIHGLQLAAVALVLGLLAQPALEVLRLAAGANTVAVLVDASESMALPSGEGEGESRFEVAARLVDEPLVAAAGDAAVVRFAFDERLRLLGDGEVPQAVGQRSRLVDALTELATHYAEGALAAVVVLTDGAQNGDDGVDLTALSAAGVPAHVVGVGPSAVAGDVELKALYAAGAGGSEYAGEGSGGHVAGGTGGRVWCAWRPCASSCSLRPLQGMTLDKTAAATENSLALSRPLCNACTSNRNRMWLDGAKGQAHSSPAASAEGLYLA